MTMKRNSAGKIKIAVPARLDAILFEYSLKKMKDIELTIAPAREIPRLLHDRKVDCALVPSVMYFQGDYEIVPDAAISTFFEIGTEILVSSKPLAEMRSVAFSRMPDTSRVILEVALRELFPEIPYRFEIGTGNPFKDLESCDATVVTGEGAFGLPDDYHLYNVGEFWVRLTELPAVFYLWLVPAELPVPAKQRAYAHVMLAKKTGLAKIDKVVRLAQERVTLNRYRMIEYLTVELDYDLFIKQVKSLDLLGEYMSGFKLIQEEKRRDLVFATQRSHVSVFEEVFGAGDVSIDDIVLDFDLDDE